MRLFTKIKVEQCSPAEEFDPATRQKKPKQTKDGKPVYRLKGVTAGPDDRDVSIEVNSLQQLKPGTHMVELEAFAIAKDGKRPQVFFRVKGVA